MAEYVVMPKEDYEAACNSIRGKTGKTDLIKSGNLSAEIDSITGGGGGSAEGCVTVTFMNGDVELFSRPVYIGDDCPDPITQGRFDTPTKESTAQYNYTFYGWGDSDGGAADANILKNITSDKTVYAIFTATAKPYTITWLDEDGSVLKTEDWPYGTVPSYTPVKDGVVFGGWNPEPVAVTGDASYTVIWASVLASGTFTTGPKWTMMTDGTLNISGTGALPDYTWKTYSSNPVYAYRADIKKMVVEKGVTSIGAAFFYGGYSNLASVTLPEGLTSIGTEAFYNRSSLVSINLPNTLTSLGAHVFYSCSSLKSITIPRGITTIGESTFNGCTSLTDVTLPDTLTSIGPSSFAKCAFTSIDLPDGLTNIGGSAFSSSSLESITIPGSVTTFGSQIFYSSANLTSVTISDGVTSIPSYMFESCTSLSSVTIPNGVTSISSSAFRKCSNLTSITIPGSVTSISSSAFGDSGLASAVFENPNSWMAGDTALSATDLANPATAATYLKSTYRYSTWTRS